MKKQGLVTAIILSLFLSSFTMNFSVQAQDNAVTPVQDNHTHGYGATIYSPLNQTYQPNQSITIHASSPTLGGSNIIYSATYIIDDSPLRRLDYESRQVHSWDPFFGALIGTGTLPPLPEGKHKLTVYMKTYIQTTAKPTMAGEATVYFSVGDTESPKITLNAINNVTFNQTSIPLIFTTNEATSWMGYCLDNGIQTTITGNTTLKVAAGNHTITLYANDSRGNMGKSEMAYFVVQLPEVASEQKVHAQIVLFGLGLISAVSAAAIFVYFKNRKRRER